MEPWTSLNAEMAAMVELGYLPSKLVIDVQRLMLTQDGADVERAIKTCDDLVWQIKELFPSPGTPELKTHLDDLANIRSLIESGKWVDRQADVSEEPGESRAEHICRAGGETFGIQANFELLALAAHSWRSRVGKECNDLGHICFDLGTMLGIVQSNCLFPCKDKFNGAEPLALREFIDRLHSEDARQLLAAVDAQLEPGASGAQSQHFVDAFTRACTDESLVKSVQALPLAPAFDMPPVDACWARLWLAYLDDWACRAKDWLRAGLLGNEPLLGLEPAPARWRRLRSKPLTEKERWLLRKLATSGQVLSGECLAAYEDSQFPDRPAVQRATKKLRHYGVVPTKNGYFMLPWGVLKFRGEEKALRPTND